MKTISLCMIVKDEENTLARCLSSVCDIVDEIIIVDTGSQDQTVKTALAYESKVCHFQWEDDFSKARNFSFSQASMDYILWLDGDDVLLDQDRVKLKKLKDQLMDDVDAYSMIYHYAFDADGNVLLSLRRNRLFRRAKGFEWQGMVHEYIEVNEQIVDTDICITHKSVKDSLNRNLLIYENSISKGNLLTYRDTYYYAKELYDHEQFEKAVEVFLKFLEMKEGWFEEKIAACLKIARYYSSIEKYELCRHYCFKTFEYGSPRPESCYQIGCSYYKEKKLEQAIFWLKLSIKVYKEENTWAFSNPGCGTWLAHLQLCLCYYELGDLKEANCQNELAYRYHQKDENILFNRVFFKKLLTEGRSDG